MLDELGLEHVRVAGLGTVALPSAARGRADQQLARGFQLLVDIRRNATVADSEATLTWPFLSREMIADDILDRAREISCPTLIVAGEDDQLVLAPYAREFDAALPTARIKVMDGPGATLGVLAGRATGFNDLAAAFLPEMAR